MKKIIALLVLLAILMTGCPFFGGEKIDCNAELSAARNASIICNKSLASCTKENADMRTEVAKCQANVERAQANTERCQGSLQSCIDENKGLKDRISQLENASRVGIIGLIAGLIFELAYFFLGRFLDYKIDPKTQPWLVALMFVMFIFAGILVLFYFGLLSYP